MKIEVTDVRLGLVVAENGPGDVMKDWYEGAKEEKGLGRGVTWVSLPHNDNNNNKTSVSERDSGPDLTS